MKTGQIVIFRDPHDAGEAKQRGQDGKFVQCSRDWRETQPVGLPLALSVTLRADGKCWVHQPRVQ